MIILIIIGWVVALPMLVIAGLCLGPILAGRHATARRPDDVIARSREFVGVAPDEFAAVTDIRSAGPRQPVRAGY